MNSFKHDRFFVCIDGLDTELNDMSKVKERIYEVINLKNKGSISLAADDGKRPWWQRIFFGAQTYVRPYFLFEWFEDTCSLIFQDENASEYRVLSSEGPEDVSESIRKKISFGEYKPLDVKYCISKSIALKAIKEFLNTGEMPKWLEYDFVE